MYVLVTSYSKHLKAKHKIDAFSHPYHPCMLYLPIYIWLILMVNAGKYTIHGCYGPYISSPNPSSFVVSPRSAKGNSTLKVSHCARLMLKTWSNTNLGRQERWRKWLWNITRQELLKHIYVFNIYIYILDSEWHAINWKKNSTLTFAMQYLGKQVTIWSLHGNQE